MLQRTSLLQSRNYFVAEWAWNRKKKIGWIWWLSSIADRCTVYQLASEWVWCMAQTWGCWTGCARSFESVLQLSSFPFCPHAHLFSLCVCLSVCAINRQVSIQRLLTNSEALNSKNYNSLSDYDKSCLFHLDLTNIYLYKVIFLFTIYI